MTLPDPTSDIWATNPQTTPQWRGSDDAARPGFFWAGGFFWAAPQWRGSDDAARPRTVRSPGPCRSSSRNGGAAMTLPDLGFGTGGPAIQVGAAMEGQR